MSILGITGALRLSLRRLRRAPGFAIAAALTLALGVGGTVAVFTVVNGVLLRPLPYPNADRLVDLSHTLAVSGILHVDQSDATYLLYRRDNRVFADVGAYRASAVNVQGGGAASAERLSAVVATPSVFHVLGAPVLRGRALVEADGEPSAPPVVVVSEGLWRRSFGGDPSIIGRRVTVDGIERTIVGVMPAAFEISDVRSALWLPLQLDQARTKSAAFDFRGIARLRDGVTLAAAAADLERLLPEVPQAFPGRLTVAAILATHMEPVVRPLRDVIVGDVARVLWIVLGGVGTLLIVACSNVANLFLARSEGRQRELAVRRALGAGRRALVLDFASEAIVLASIGGVVGLALAAGALHLLQASGVATNIPRFDEVGIDGAVVAVTVLVTAFVALVVSILPALQSGSAGQALAPLLGAQGASAAGGRVRHRARRALVVAQVAFALVLVTTAGLFARSFGRLLAVDPGFDAAHALAFRLALPEVTYPSAASAARVVVGTLDALSALPGVTATGVVTQLPLDAEARQDSAVFVEDHPLAPNVMPNIHEMEFASPGYFKAMGIPLLAGRTFAAPEPGRDPALSPREVVVSEAFAARYGGTRWAVGRRIRMNPTDPWSTIVGVVGSVRGDGLEQRPVEAVYMPLVTTSAAGMPWTPRNVAFVVRTSGDPAAASAAVRAAVASAAPNVPIYRDLLLSELRAHAVARTTFTLVLLGAAAGLALVIGAMGIYGVIAYLVSLRTREIGVRIALGAQASDVKRLMVGRALTDAAIGVAIGLGGAIAVGHAAASALFGVTATDPLTFVSAAIVLLATAVGASWIPARRAAALDPAEALRTA